MRASLAMPCVVVTVLLFQVSSALTPAWNRFVGPSVTPSTLSAMPQSSSGPRGSRGVPSKTARESAFNVEWEPMTELERRIEDGAHYDHIPEALQQRQKRPATVGVEKEDENVPQTRGVFIGYRHTKEEYDRLKSADPSH